MARDAIAESGGAARDGVAESGSLPDAPVEGGGSKDAVAEADSSRDGSVESGPAEGGVSVLDSGPLIDGFESGLGPWTLDNGTYGTLGLTAGTSADEQAPGDAGSGALLSFSFPSSAFTAAAGYTGTSCAKYGAISAYQPLPCVAAMRPVSALRARSIEVWFKQRSPGTDLAFRVVDSSGNYFDYDLDVLQLDLATNGWLKYVVDLGSPAYVSSGARQEGPHRGTMQPPKHPYAPPDFTYTGGATTIAQIGVVVMPIHNGWSTGSTYSTTAGSVTIDDIRVADPATALPISATSPITRAVSDVDLLTATAAVLPACSTAACGAAYLGTVGVNAHQGTTLASTYTTLVNDLKDLNLTEVRGGSSWAYVESTKGSYNTGGLGFFSAAMSAGLKSVFVLAYDNPLYDSLQAGKTSCNDGVDDSGGPVTQGFLGYTNAMVKSWGTSSVFWEVWNEPDASYSWNDPTSATCVSYGDDGTRYAPFLAKVLAQAKTTASAQALAPPVLTSAGIGGAADFQMLKAIIGQYVADGAPSDGVAIHPYVGGANFQYPEEILTSYDYLNALLAANFGGAARIWSTESGVATSDFDAHGNYVRCNLSLPYSTNLSTALTNAATCLAAGSDGLSAGGRETQAIFTARGMLTHLTSGIVHDLIYELSDGGAPASGTDLVVPVASDPNEAITRVSDESNFGLLEGNFNYFAPTGGVLGKKPAYYAVKGVTAFLAGKQLDGVVPMSLTGLNALRLRDALHKYVVLWAEDADAQYRVYLPAAATAVLATCGLSSNGAYDNCSGVQPYPTPIGSDAGGDYVTVDRHPLYLTF